MNSHNITQNFVLTFAFICFFPKVGKFEDLSKIIELIEMVHRLFLVVPRLLLDLGKDIPKNRALL